MLHITNGDCAVEALTRGGVAGDDILPWRDVLHEGPVPAGLTLDELSSVRAAFIAECDWGDLDQVREDFRARDCRLAGAQAEDEVVLWFESDLYDQLQLIQLLDWFSDPTHRPARLSCVCVDEDPDTGRFLGLGGLQPERVADCFAQREPVTQQQIDLGRTAWAAFRADRPSALDRFRSGAAQGLPYLHDAVLRLLQELPAVGDGLSRSERTALEALADRPCTREQLFRAAQAREERPFMGDWSFWRLLDWLGRGSMPLVEAYDLPAGVTTIQQTSAAAAKQALAITQAGRSVLRGELDAVVTNGIHRWLGGTRLWRGDTLWRWDGARAAVVPGRTSANRSKASRHGLCRVLPQEPGTGSCNKVGWEEANRMRCVMPGFHIIAAACAFALALSGPAKAAGETSAGGMYSNYSTADGVVFERAFDTSPAENLDELVKQLTRAIDRLARYRVPKDPPAVYRVPHAELENYVCGTNCNIKAWYKPGDGIFLDDTLKPETNLFHRSILLHEMVHYFQDRAGEYATMNACDRWFHRELDAYTIQNRYLGVIGHPGRVAYTGDNCTNMNAKGRGPSAPQTFDGIRGRVDPDQH